MAHMDRVKRAPEKSQSHQREPPCRPAHSLEQTSHPRLTDLVWTSVRKSGEVKRPPLLQAQASSSAGGLGERRCDR